MSNITKLYPKDAATNPDAVLEQAIGVYGEVLIIGWDKFDELNVRSTTTLNASQVLWLIEVFKQKLLNGDYCE